MFSMFLMVVLELSMMLLVASIDSVPAQMFPKKQICADPEDCPTIAELLPLKWKEQIITTEIRKQKDQSQNNQLPKKWAGCLTNSQSSFSVTLPNLLSEIAAVLSEELSSTCTSSLLNDASNKGRIRCFSNKDSLMTCLANKSSFAGRVWFMVSGEGNLRCMELWTNAWQNGIKSVMAAGLLDVPTCWSVKQNLAAIGSKTASVRRVSLQVCPGLGFMWVCPGLGHTRWHNSFFSGQDLINLQSTWSKSWPPVACAQMRIMAFLLDLGLVLSLLLLASAPLSNFKMRSKTSLNLTKFWQLDPLL